MNEIKKPYKYVGTAPVRPDGVPKVTGTAKYGNDYTLPGTLYGKILRSPHAHARIKSIDTNKIKTPSCAVDIRNDGSCRPLAGSVS